MPNVTLIETGRALEDFVARASAAAWLGLDTEFVRDRTYFPRAGLIQIATPAEIALVDPVRLASLAPLAPLLFASPALKILHAGRQDLELFTVLFDRVPARFSILKRLRRNWASRRKSATPRSRKPCSTSPPAWRSGATTGSRVR